MHPISVLTFGIFLSGYITARWDLVSQLIELAVFAWDRGVITRAAKGFGVLSIFFVLILIPIERIANKEVELFENVKHALSMRFLFRGCPHPIENIVERCGGKNIEVLGTLNDKDTPKPFNRHELSLHTVPRSKIPRIDCAEDAGVTVQIVTFDRPDPDRMQYLSLTQISLALGDKRGTFGSEVPFDTIDKEEDLERKRREALVDKLKLHTVVKHPRTEKELALDSIINQINCSAEVDQLMQSNIGLVGVRVKRTQSVSERVVLSATNAYATFLIRLKDAFKQHIWPFASKVFIFCLMAHRIIAEGLILLLDWRPVPESAALKDISATAQQVDIRLQQFCYWPKQYLTLHRRRKDWVSITNSHPEYIRFFNSLWLVANDVIIGIALGSYIFENADFVATQMDQLIDIYSIDGLQRMIEWLMGWPAGLKLNNELAKFLGDLFLWVIDYWDNCMRQLQPALPHIIRLIGISSFAGASLPISMFSDLVSLLTIHIYSFYVASARIYNWQLSIIVSLFHLFRGKKRNVLRNRIDSCDYDLDQLLLGTILFTLLFFLLPTVAVFYATFAGARIAIIALKAGLDTWLACLNHFPLFALMLRIKDSRRLPGGIRFELQDTSAALLSPKHNTHSEPRPQSAPTSYIKLKYAQLGHRVRKHYFSPRVFLAIVSGQFVPPIHRKNLYGLQYSMLPKQRVSVGELWRLLTEDRREKQMEVANGFVVNGFPAGAGARRGAGRKGGVGYWWSR
ncbi:pig-Q [Saxophila tyrrhenica]|uniref:Pig-Q n=1 Tax=Saxophila tyrrhenica TaxID=1690608 RepID=A0AAV9PG85_9PEZI|nr:pig-Q [Saxophila tyrrhenica]